MINYTTVLISDTDTMTNTMKAIYIGKIEEIINMHLS